MSKDDSFTLHIRISGCQKWLLDRDAFRVNTTYGRYAKRIFDDAYRPTDDQMREYEIWKRQQGVPVPLPGTTPQRKIERKQREGETSVRETPVPQPETPIQYGNDDEYEIEEPIFQCPVCGETHYKMQLNEVRRLAGTVNELYAPGDVVPAIEIKNVHGGYKCWSCKTQADEHAEFAGVGIWA